VSVPWRSIFLTSGCQLCFILVDIDRGELELPEELPYFPYEKELEEELRLAGIFTSVFSQDYHSLFFTLRYSSAKRYR